MRLDLLARALAAMAFMFAAAAACAQSASSYPNQSVHMIVPFPAGGPADILARVSDQANMNAIAASARANKVSLM